MKVSRPRKPTPRIGDTRKLTVEKKLPPVKSGRRRVMVATPSSCSSVPAQVAVTLPAWPEGWSKEGRTG